MSPGSLRAICSAWGGSGARPPAGPAGGLLVACRDSERCLWLAAAQSRGHLVLALPLLGVTCFVESDFVIFLAVMSWMC